MRYAAVLAGGGSVPAVWSPGPDSNRHINLRRVALCPLSYRESGSLALLSHYAKAYCRIMSNSRTYSDEDLILAVAAARRWADVAEALGKPRTYNTFSLKKVAARLNLDTTHLTRRLQTRRRTVHQVPADDHTRSLFTARRGQSCCSGLSVAVRWFLDHGYPVSLPVETAPYDLVAESDAGLQRVQVKTTTQVGDSGRAEVRIVHHNGRVPGEPRRRGPYTKDEIDLFFVIAGERRYVIPVEATGGSKTLTLDVKYEQFQVT